MIRGCSGVIYEPHDARTERYQAADLIGMSAPAPVLPLVDHVALYDGEWPDQGISESCVGHAICQAVTIRQGALGIPPHERITPSPTDVYYRARASRHGYHAVVDIGSNPVAGWEVLRPPGTEDGIGIVTLDELPFAPGLVDAPPDPALYRRAIERDWLSYWWVLEDGQDRLVQVDALLRAGRPVTAAITCGQDIQTWRPADGPWRYRGPRKGGHYVCLVYSDSESFWVINSWGSGYGLGGLLQIARDEIASSRTSYLATPEINLEKLRRAA
jgi:hypothetical protein